MKFKIAIVAAVAATGIGIAAVNGAFTSTNSRLLSACLETIKDREDAPQAVEILNSIPPSLRPATFSDYMGWDTYGKKDNDTARAEAQPAAKALLESNTAMFAIGPMTIAEIGILYLAPNASGVSVKRGGNCTVIWPRDEDPFSRPHSTVVRINGLTDYEWHLNRIEELQNLLKG